MRRVVARVPRRLRLPVLVLAGALALAALGGCEVKKGSGDMVNGKKLFVQKCGSCHTLDRASTKGTVGPNLDQAFARSLHDGFKRDAIRDVVEKQILYPNINGVMPPKLVKGDDANDVASYVAYAAARSGKDTGALASAVGPSSGPGALFVAQGCGSCHTLKAAGTGGTTGPNLDKVLAHQTPDFIHTSIVDPNKAIAPGYPPNVMPQDYGRKLTKQQLKQLVDYLAKVAGK